jgi:hypothetical protein
VTSPSWMLRIEPVTSSHPTATDDAITRIPSLVFHASACCMSTGLPSSVTLSLLCGRAVPVGARSFLDGLVPIDGFGSPFGSSLGASFDSLLPQPSTSNATRT